PDCRLRRTAHLELRDHPVDPLNVGIDCPPVVASDRDREGDVTDLSRHVSLQLACPECLLRRFGRLSAFLPGGLRWPRVHGPSMTDSVPESRIVPTRRSA